MSNDLPRNQVDLPRVHALDHAIRSVAGHETPPGDDAIVARAEKFLAFLDA